MQRKTDQAMTMPDFFDFTVPTVPGVDEETVFACSSSDEDGAGCVAITEEAVYLGENEGIIRIHAPDIQRWSSAARGRLFLLTIEARNAHSTHLVTDLRRATVSAMTKVIGPENTRLRAA